MQQEKVDFVIGPVISQIELAAAPVLNAANIASFGSTGSLAITPAVAPYYFSTLVSAAAQANKMASHAAQALHARSGAIISDSGAQAKDFVQNMRREMQAAGIKLTGVQEYQYRAIDMTPQLLALKHARPDTLFLFASSGEDAGNVIKSLGDVGWNPPVTGNWTLGTFVDAMEKVCGAAALENVTGSNYAGFTYCAGGAQPQPYLDFVARAKQFNGGPAARLSLTMAALFHDAVMLFKAAVEGSGGRTDGATVAAWVERNGASFRGIAGPVAPSKESHFLYGPDALAVVHPARRGEAGIQERVAC
ncbi:MAG: ABC transporter substrate-binding protein [Rhodospirillales bacterium]|nr:ABC transporter substrate-binding protein [Rhodospirillales bacterium]